MRELIRSAALAVAIACLFGLAFLAFTSRSHAAELTPWSPPAATACECGPACQCDPPCRCDSQPVQFKANDFGDPSDVLGKLRTDVDELKMRVARLEGGQRPTRTAAVPGRIMVGGVWYVPDTATAAAGGSVAPAPFEWQPQPAPSSTVVTTVPGAALPNTSYPGFSETVVTYTAAPAAGWSGNTSRFFGTAGGGCANGACGTTGRTGLFGRLRGR